MEKIIKEEKELLQLAQEILNFNKENKVFVFIGELGTGKTTLIKKICAILGVDDQTSSPTYSIVNEYIYLNTKIYHIDLYRLNSIEEVFEIGFEEYIYSENYCFIEWPQIATELLPEKFLTIKITKQEDSSRVFNISFL